MNNIILKFNENKKIILTVQTHSPFMKGICLHKDQESSPSGKNYANVFT